ncbi:FmdB family zinc ribbon protein [Arthrobacter sp. 35/47]|uniref:FmdB family zinc ribbon protein n=1 Tax=Arthrobacter sp. 35/47 TaxID=269454 RepID=UPI000479AC90|nr:FmdB family zinc ribbon protein [Arthrobacter sp. 35/47]
MPTYAYACRDCGHAFDVQQSFSDDSLTVCPECEGLLRKKFNSVGVVFKGSGFYRTDSRSSSSSVEPGTASKSAPAATGAEGKAATSSTSSSGASGKAAAAAATSA